MNIIKCNQAFNNASVMDIVDYIVGTIVAGFIAV